MFANMVKVFGVHLIYAEDVMKADNIFNTKNIGRITHC